MTVGDKTWGLQCEQLIKRRHTFADKEQCYPVGNPLESPQSSLSPFNLYPHTAMPSRNHGTHITFRSGYALATFKVPKQLAAERERNASPRLRRF